MEHKKKRGLLASLGAVVTAAALTLGGAAGAQAQQTTPETSAPVASDVVITKLSQPDAVQDYASGAPADYPEGAYPIEGVEFQAQKVQDTGVDEEYDIGTNAGQQYVAGLESTDVPLDESAAPTVGSTGSDGQLTWDSVPRGLYVVTETSTPTGVIPAEDFFLSVPLTNPTGSGWLDPIYVYPKNAHINNPEDPNDPSSPNAATKTVSNADAFTAGQDVTWTISSPIPRIASTPGNFEATDQFEIRDAFNDEQLLLNEESIAVTAPEDLEAGVHYTVDVSRADGQTEVTVAFTDEQSGGGLQSLAAALDTDPDARVSVDITTQVVSTGETENVAEIIPHSTVSPISVSSEVRYGGYQFSKVSSADQAPLAGAEFRVYTSEADAQAGENHLVLPAGSAYGTWNEETASWVSDENGQVTIDGLRYSNFANGTAIEAPNEPQTYYLAEVTAPADHQISGDITEFQVTAPMADGASIENVPTSEGGFQLPLTGGMGTAILTILGLAILAAVIVVARRRRANADLTA